MARVIKSGGERVVPGEVADARARAQGIVASAEAVREAARQEGFEAGRQEGLASVTELLARAQSAAAAKAASAEASLTTLAVRIARKILGRELELRPEAVADVVRGALAAAATRQEIVVRVHPDDVELVRSVRPGLAVHADPSVARGGCLVDTEVGTIDARLDAQLAAIERALAAAAGR